MDGTGSVISFEPVTVRSSGTIYDLLRRSYREWMESVPHARNQLIEEWREFERFALSVDSSPVGRCFFLTLLDGAAVGLGSFDPRGLPVFAAVGQNCVDPHYRRRGIGTAQLHHIIFLMRTHDSFHQSTEIRVLTGGGVHYAAARAMYESIGFVEATRGHDAYGLNVTYVLGDSSTAADQSPSPR